MHDSFSQIKSNNFRWCLAKVNLFRLNSWVAILKENRELNPQP